MEQCSAMNDLRGEKGVVILEVGAGTGWVTAALSPLFPNARYISTDISSEAMRKLGELGLPTVEPVVTGDVSTLGVQADLVICGDVIEHVREESRVQFMNSLVLALNPGGLLLLSTPNKFLPILYLNRLLGREATGQPYDRPLSPQELVNLVESAGISIDICETSSAPSGPEISARSFMRKVALDWALRLVGMGLRIAGRNQNHAIFVRGSKARPHVMPE